MKTRLVAYLLPLLFSFNACVNISPLPLTAVDQSVQTQLNVFVKIDLKATGKGAGNPTYNVTPPSNGALSGTPPRLIYTPDTDFVGLDSFTFTVSSGEQISNPATVAIEVIPSIYPIVLQGAVPEEVSVSINMTKPANATSGALTLQAFDADNAAEGELIINGNLPIALFGLAANTANASATVPAVLITPGAYWNDGTNTLLFRHTSTAGYIIEGLSVSFQQ